MLNTTRNVETYSFEIMLDTFSTNQFSFRTKTSQLEGFTISRNLPVQARAKKNSPVYLTAKNNIQSCYSNNLTINISKKSKSPC